MKLPLVFDEYGSAIDTETRSGVAKDHGEKAVAEMVKIVLYPGRFPTCVIWPVLLRGEDVEVLSSS